jgi:hypothetical protein
MTTRLRVRFDGRVLVPLDPVDLAVGPYDIVIDNIAPPPSDQPPLAKLAEIAKKFPPRADSPGDAAAQHDHYLYGTPKRDDP